MEEVEGINLYKLETPIFECEDDICVCHFRNEVSLVSKLHSVNLC